MAGRLLDRSTWQTTPQPKPTGGNIFLNPPTTTAPKLSSPTAPKPASSNIFLQGGSAPTSSAPPALPTPTTRHDDPIARLNIDVAKIQSMVPGLDKATQERARRLLADVGQGVPSYERFQIEHGQGGDPLNPIEQSIRNGHGWDLGAPAVGAAGAVIRQVSRPYQAVASGVGEWSRGAEQSGKAFQIGPIKIPTGASPRDILSAGRAGWNLQRHDSPSSILNETTETRREQGRLNPGLLTGYNATARTVPGTRLVTDLAVGAAIDPLTWLTFGTSSLAKRSLEVVADATDPITAARVAREGVEALTPAEQATVQARLGTRGWESLERGAQKGIGVRRPFGAETGRTILPTSRIAEGARGAVAAAEDVPVLGAAVRGAERGGQFVERIFRPRAGVLRDAELGRDVDRNLYQLDARARGYRNANTERYAEELLNSMRKAHVTPDEMRSVVGPALDVGGTNLAGTQRLQDVIDRFGAGRDEITNLLVEQGKLLPDSETSVFMHGPVPRPRVAPEDLSAAQAAAFNANDAARVSAANEARVEPVIANENFLPRIRTKEGDELYNSGQLGSTGMSGRLRQDPHLQARAFARDMSIKEINEQVSREIGRPIEYFHEDPLIAQVHRARRAFGSKAADEYTEGLLNLRGAHGQQLVTKWDDLPRAEGFGDLTNRLATGQRDLGDGRRLVSLVDPETGIPNHYAVPGPVADLVEKTWHTIHDPTELAKGYDALLNWWKTMATVPLPFGLGFHLRNAESNVLLNWMSGIGVSPADYFKANRLQKAMKMGVNESGDWRHFLTAQDQYLVEQALEREVLSSGVLGAIEDVNRDPNLARGYTLRTKTTGEKAKFLAQRANPVSTKGIMATGGRRLGEAVEENARLAHFLAATRNLGDVDAAANSVRRWLFDYHDVTASEQQIKKLIPFYTWSRKATSVAIETILRDPRKLAEFNRLRQSIAESAGVDLSGTLVPRYLRDNPTAVPIGVAGEGLVGRVAGYGQAPGTPLIAAPDTPLNAPAEILNTAYSGISALPGLNRILPNAGEGPVEAGRGLLGMIGGPAGILKAAAEDVAGVNFFSGAPIRDEYVTTPRALGWIPGMDRMTASTRNLVNAAWPTATKIEGLYPRDPLNKDKQMRRILSTLTGLPVYPIALTTQQAEAYRRLEPVAKFLSLIKSQAGLG